MRGRRSVAATTRGCQCLQCPRYRYIRCYMNLNAVLVFCHVLGAIGLFVVLAFERLALSRLQRATSREQAGEWIRVCAILPRLRMPSVLLILAPALYWTFTAWRGVPWVYISLIAVVATALTGKFMSAKAFERLARAVNAELFSSPDTLPETLWGTLWGSLHIRTGLVVGLLAIMVLKPNAIESVSLLGAAVMLALLLGLYSRVRTRRVA